MKEKAMASDLKSICVGRVRLKPYKKCCVIIDKLK